jgi:hypothetical protein
MSNRMVAEESSITLQCLIFQLCVKHNEEQNGSWKSSISLKFVIFELQNIHVVNAELLFAIIQ